MKEYYDKKVEWDEREGIKERWKNDTKREIIKNKWHYV